MRENKREQIKEVTDGSDFRDPHPFQNNQIGVLWGKVAWEALMSQELVLLPLINRLKKTILNGNKKFLL
ncbi:MAG: hypothetical protein ACTSRE_13650 [Promethearchaeota archaeon]